MCWHRPLASQHRGKTTHKKFQTAQPVYCADSAATKKVSCRFFPANQLCPILAEKSNGGTVRIEGCKHAFMIHYPSLSNSAVHSLVKCNASVTALPDLRTPPMCQPTRGPASFCTSSTPPSPMNCDLSSSAPAKDH
mmetsp:Transcript_61129/g.117819  ORF Transcript_61129/g.117819 Transcript_61129/m.117819 type:complete len:136 (+) Transcript_61129:111-518(+)